MKLDKTVANILDRAQAGRPPLKGRLHRPPGIITHIGRSQHDAGHCDALMRQRFGNEGLILGQIGLGIAACPGKCKFCSFGEGHTTFQPSAMTDADILEAAKRFTATGELYALFLMTMHTFEFDRLLKIVQLVRQRIPAETKIVVNVGDFDAVQAAEFKAAGVNGSYHVCRLREGIDTALDPMQRRKTITAIKHAGLDWYYCCEPIGPEHSSQEIVEQLWLGIEFGCFQHAAMRRVYIPSSPLANYGQITELRLAQIVAVIALASLGCPDTKNIAVHEPNLIGLTAGANVVYAETGANPRDTVEETTGNRGRDLAACKTMLYEAGFDHLRCGENARQCLENAFRK